VLIAVSLSAILAPLNSTLIAVALPAIVEDFESDLATASWLVTGYLIVLAAMQPTLGKVGDRLGRRRLMLAGLVVFGAASIGAALAPTLPALIALRLLQAVGAGITLPNGVAVIREVIGEERRAAAFGLIASALGIAAAIGPAFGGLIVAAGSWPSVFYANVPVVAAAIVMVWRYVPRGAGELPRERFDLVGAVLLACGTGAIALLITEGPGRLGTVWLALAAAALTLLGIAFVAYERRVGDPVVRPDLFRVRAFAAATLGVALSNLAFYTMIIATPIVLITELGWSSVSTGLALTLLSGPLIILAPLGGRLADRVGRRVPSMLGHGTATVGLAPLAFTTEPGAALLLACMGLAGMGFGLAFASLQTAAVEAVPVEEAGVASGIYSTSRYFGSIIGSAALAGLLVVSTDAVDGLRDVAIMVTVSAFLSTLTVAALPRRVSIGYAR
jgi:EmrB/QacA subfamily drug resistance transporter